VLQLRHVNKCHQCPLVLISVVSSSKQFNNLFKGSAVQFKGSAVQFKGSPKGEQFKAVQKQFKAVQKQFKAVQQSI
jgi:hypothetical protein